MQREATTGVVTDEFTAHTAVQPQGDLGSERPDGWRSWESGLVDDRVYRVPGDPVSAPGEEMVYEPRYAAPVAGAAIGAIGIIIVALIGLVSTGSAPKRK